MPLPNIQSLARFGQIFNQLRQPTPTLPQGMVQPFGGFNPPQEPEFDIDAEIAKIYQPRHQMQDLTSQMIGDFPQRDQHPSVWRRIGAVLAGMGAGLHGEDPMQAANRFQNFHYLNNVADWKARFDPLSKAADDERLANAQELALARQTVGQKQAQMKIDETERKNREMGERQRFDSETRRMRAYTYDWKTRNPNMVLETRGEDVYGVNPQTGAATIIRDPQTGQPIKGALFGQKELADINAEHRMEQIGAQGANQLANTKARAEQNWTTINVPMPDGKIKSYRYNPSTGAVEDIKLPEGAGPVQKPGTTPKPGGGTTSPLDERRKIRNRAQQAEMDHPEWQPFIGFGPNDQVVIKSWRERGGPSQTMYNQIRDYINSGQQQQAPQLLAPGLSGGTKKQSYGTQIDAVIKEAVEKGMKEEDVVAELKRRGVIK